MRKYLLTVVLKSDSKTPETLSLLEEAVEGLPGKVSKGTELPQKKLAYPIGGMTEAIFWQVELEGPGEIVGKVSEALRVSDQVLRFVINSAPVALAKKG